MKVKGPIERITKTSVTIKAALFPSRLLNGVSSLLDYL
jgi:hypothetical protein